MKRPTQANTISTVDGDLGSSSPDNLIRGKIAATTQNFITGFTEWSILEEAIELNQMDSFLKPYGIKMAVEHEQRLLAFMSLNSGLTVGTGGTAVSKWSDVSAGNTLLESMGAPNSENWFALLAPAVQQNLANVQTALLESNLVKSAWERAMIPSNFGGLQALRHNSLPSFTQGAFGAGPITVDGGSQEVGYVAVKDTMTQTINLTGLTNTTGTFVAGTQLQFDTVQWVNQQSKVGITGGTDALEPFTCTVVVGGTADGSGNVTVTITPPIIVDATNPQYNNVVAGPANSAAVTVISGATGTTNKPNLFYDKDAFAIGTVVLPPMKSLVSSTINVDGFSIRETRFADGIANKQMVRWDLLPVFAVNNPMMAGKMYGTP